MKIRNLKSKIWKLKKLEIPKIFKIFDKLKIVKPEIKNFRIFERRMKNFNLWFSTLIII